MAKELLRLAVVGSVDDGKSTLIGRLLFERGLLHQDHIEQVKKASKQNGEELDFSLFTDGLKAEREQAITIDVAYRHLSTERREIVLADTPGHLQYTRNMATGASRADAAVVLVDARSGPQPQTRRHAYILKLLGVPHVAVAVNKMDAVDYSKDRFEQLRDELERYLGGFGFQSLEFFPVSARRGDNLLTPSPQMPWNRAGALGDYLDRVPLERGAKTAWRFPVQYVLRPDQNYRGFAGQLVSGTLQTGDEVVVLPSGQRSRVKAIDGIDGEQPFATAPESITVRLEHEVDVSRGDVLAPAEDRPRLTRELDAMVVWLNDRPLEVDRPLLVRHLTRAVPGKVTAIHGRIDLETLGELAATALGPNEIGRVTVSLSRPLPVDPYSRNRATGAFVLVDPLSNVTIAAGMVLPPRAGALEEAREVIRVSPAERQRRTGHAAAVVWVERERDADAVEAAAALERALFDRGLTVTLIEADANASLAVAEAGLVAVHAARGDTDQRRAQRAALSVGPAVLHEAGDPERIAQLLLHGINAPDRLVTARPPA
jgi:bifunctional enzyme CysN/CysC/sulfate adenylyltransferase subunit 1